ncbi:MAG TPA: MBL fold metallo-hydrolase [Vicinamibacteria bacterium]|nr:MBL fold metallo-hydrolase [Vicinamibacteria bacterium]
MIQLGDIRVHILSDGRFALDGGAMFGVVPRVIWEKTDPPDQRNRIALGLNVVLIEAAGKRILVDTGAGDKWGEKEARIYGLDRSRTLLAGLHALGLEPGDIDIVINSHLHFDHAGGNTRLADGKPVPTFPKARYVVQTGEWEDATRPHERNRASYLEENYVPLAERKQLEVVQGAVEVTPGVRVVPVGGHTAYLQMVVVESQGQTLAIPTDLIPTSSHLPLPFIMAYDLFPVGTLEAKRRLLAQVVEEKWWLLFYHDPRMAVGRVGRDQEKYVLSEVLA